MAKKTGTSNKKRVVKVEAYGQAHISSTFNNIIVSLTNNTGQVISWSSAGVLKRTLLMLLKQQLKIALRWLMI